MNAALNADMASAVRGVWRADEPMSRHSTWRCGGPARRYFAPADRADLCAFLQRKDCGDGLLWLGLGSNVLVRDGGLKQTVIATSAGLTRLRWDGTDVIYAECGVTCARLAREAATRDRAGLEFMAGIPGTLGGALAMNAGALGSEIWSFVSAVELIDAHGHVERHSAEAFTPRYRGIEGPAGWFLAAWLRLAESADGCGPQRIRAVLAQRNATQPTGQASCGSVFKNPRGDYAGRLIEACGLKGFRVGGCHVSEVHANFIVNDGSASAGDIERLMSHVRKEVARQTGVHLEPEVRIVGEHPPGAVEVAT